MATDRSTNRTWILSLALALLGLGPACFDPKKFADASAGNPADGGTASEAGYVQPWEVGAEMPISPGSTGGVSGIDGAVNGHGGAGGATGAGGQGALDARGAGGSVGGAGGASGLAGQGGTGTLDAGGQGGAGGIDANGVGGRGTGGAGAGGTSNTGSGGRGSGGTLVDASGQGGVGTGGAGAGGARTGGAGGTGAGGTGTSGTGGAGMGGAGGSGTGGTGTGGQPGSGGTLGGSCLDSTGHAKACDPVCGDGHRDLGEACDDGNTVSGDGCSSSCAVEPQFDCTDQIVPDGAPCSTNPLQQCVRLPITFRDFKSEKETGGHPDFYYLGATDAAGRVKRWCVVNAAGPAKKNDTMDRCWNIANPDLQDGKPVLNGSPVCDCLFTDWDSDTSGGRVPGYSRLVNGPLRDFDSGAVAVPANATFSLVSGHPSFHGPVPMVASATSFSQWFTDNSYNLRSDSTLELASISGGQFSFATSTHAISGGYFPLDPPQGATTTASGEPLLCNLWPYWFPAAFPGCVGDQYLFPPSVDLATYPNGVWVSAQQGRYHNFWFTSELRYRFVFRPPMEFQFTADDDLYVFVNGVLAIDLGGTHQRIPGSVSLGSGGTATTIEGGSIDAAGNITACPGTDVLTGVAATSPADCRSRVLSLGLAEGRVYELSIFHAKRHPTQNNFQMTVTGSARTMSVCQLAGHGG